ncbi:hypothetical protein Ssi03_45280 [Sphaerisporangium siamense]|nr:hypothetical protein Ssi03_45280 [Sphaerisporangium siamense]
MPPPGGPVSGPPPGGPAYGVPGVPQPAAPLRPRRRWIPLAWLVFALSVVVGVWAGFSGFVGAVEQIAPTHVFQSGGKVSAPLNPLDQPVLYASASGPTNVTCLAQDLTGQPVKLTPTTIRQTITANGRTWEGMFDITVPAAGTYQISCETQGGKVLFGIGKRLTASAGGFAKGAAALFLIPLAGFLFASIVTIVIVVRRRRARAARTAETRGAWPQAPQGPHPRV